MKPEAQKVENTSQEDPLAGMLQRLRFARRSHWDRIVDDPGKYGKGWYWQDLLLQTTMLTQASLLTAFAFGDFDIRTPALKIGVALGALFVAIILWWSAGVSRSEGRYIVSTSFYVAASLLVAETGLFIFTVAS